MEIESTPRRTLWVNGDEYAIDRIEELRAQLERARGMEHCDIWIEREEGSLLTLVANGDNAWLMFLRHRDDDAGLNSRNLGFTGPIDARAEFVLDTGERKSCPLTWVIPAGAAFAAVEYFHEHGAPSPEIAWHDPAADLSRD